MRNSRYRSKLKLNKYPFYIFSLKSKNKADPELIFGDLAKHNISLVQFYTDSAHFFKR